MFYTPRDLPTLQYLPAYLGHDCVSVILARRGRNKRCLWPPHQKDGRRRVGVVDLSLYYLHSLVKIAII